MDEFWRDEHMELLIKDIIEIFMDTPGVQLVRLSGLTKRERNVSGIANLSPEALDKLIRKFKANGIINYKYIMCCPHCRELSYQIEERDINTPKLCDSCNVMYSLISGNTLEIN